MTMGHFATALVPASRLRDAPVAFLLVCANLPDFVWMALAFGGLEPTTPTSFLDVSIQTLHAEMLFSHGAVWVLGFAAGVAGAGYALYRRREVAIWATVVVIVHLLCDYLSGWEHEVFGAGSLRVGLDLYRRSPVLAFAIEAAFAAALVTFYVRSERAQGRGPSPKRTAALYAVFAGGSLFFIANATHSMRQLFGLGGP